MLGVARLDATSNELLGLAVRDRDGRAISLCVVCDDPPEVLQGDFTCRDRNLDGEVQDLPDLSLVG